MMDSSLMNEYNPPTPTDDAASLLHDSPASSPTYNSSTEDSEQFTHKPRFILDDKKKCSRSTLLGIFCLILCLITWETMGELLQDVNLNYPKPAMLTYIIHSWYSVLLIPWVIIRRNKLKETINKHRVMVKLSVGLFPLMWLAAYLWYVSLKSTLVSANNAIYQSQCVFVYIVSLFVLGEAFDMKKVAVLALCVVGVVLIVFTASKPPPENVKNATMTTPSSSSPSNTGTHSVKIKQTLWGYIALILGVVAFAIYEVIFKKYEEKEEKRKKNEIIAAGKLSAGMVSENHQEDILEASIIFLGFCGLVNVFIGWPFIFIFDATGLEPLILPSSELTSQIMLNGFIDTIFNFAFIWGVALTSPVFMSTGTILIIPLGIVVDSLLGKGTMNFWQLCGVGFIICGFLGLNLLSIKKNNVNNNRGTNVTDNKEASFTSSVVVQDAQDMW